MAFLKVVSVSVLRPALLQVPALKIGVAAFSTIHATFQKTNTISGNDELKPFSSLSEVVHEDLLASLDRLKFSKMTPVQEQSIKPILDTKSGIVARAKTGTGKTLAFGIPVLQESFFDNRGPNEHVQSLIIAPTRDLANQIATELRNVAGANDRYGHRDIVTIVGGESKFNQIRDLRGYRDGKTTRVPSIVVGTPGRVFDILNSGNIGEKFSQIKYKVLDEADRLLDFGFQKELLQIDDYLLQNRTIEDKFKTVLFSATIDSNVKQFAKKTLGNDFIYVDTVDPNESEAHEKVKQSVVISENLYDSFVAAVEYVAKLKAEAIESKAHCKPIIFLPTTASVDFFKRLLFSYGKARYHLAPQGKHNMGRGVSIIQLHGKMSQAARDRSVRNFKNDANSILCTSSVGARGMDFPNVSHVIQIGLPSEVADYIHKVGRTGRGDGDFGEGVLFITECESSGLNQLLKRKIKFAETLSFNDIIPEREEADATIAKLITEDSLADRDSDNDSTIQSTFSSLVGYYRSLGTLYRLRSNECLKTCVEFYNRLTVQDRKPYLSSGQASSFRMPNLSDYVKLGGGGNRDYNNDRFGSGNSNFAGNRPNNRYNNSDRGSRGDNFGSFNKSDSYSRNDNYSRNDRNDKYSRNDRNDSYSRNDNYKRKDSNRGGRNNYSRGSRNGGRNEEEGFGRRSEKSNNDPFDFLA